jgi:hypothetical protein
MPDLNTLVLRSNPHVHRAGRLIKGLDYSQTSDGPHTMTAFHMACEGQLEPNPFLVMDFGSSRLYFDHDRDGCVDATETVSRTEVDPGDYYPAIDGAEKLCYGDAVSTNKSRPPFAKWAMNTCCRLAK